MNCAPRFASSWRFALARSDVDARPEEEAPAAKRAAVEQGQSAVIGFVHAVGPSLLDGTMVTVLPAAGSSWSFVSDAGSADGFASCQEAMLAAERSLIRCSSD